MRLLAFVAGLLALIWVTTHDGGCHGAAREAGRAVGEFKRGATGDAP